jgi:hypothetical protein
MCGEDSGRGFHVGTASGRPYWPLDPRPEDIHVPDLPVQLSRICRFNGAMDPKVSGIYSVAQHLVLAYTVAPTEFKLEALLHDAHEAYIHDIVKPLKLMLPDYQEIEEVNERAMREKFGLPKKISPEVKEIDRQLYATEVRDLVAKPQKGLDWGKLPAPYPFTIYPWTPQRARNAMIAVMKEQGIL